MSDSAGAHGDREWRLRELGRLSTDEHIAAAQAAGERRLAIASATLFGDEEHEGITEADYGELIGPYCGCDTCIVREILDAGWPHILAAGDALVRENYELTLALELLRTNLTAVQALAHKTIYGPDPEPSIQAMRKVLFLVSPVSSESQARAGSDGLSHGTDTPPEQT